MDEVYNSTPCDRSSGNDHPTQTLRARVIDTEEECVIGSDEEATHEIEFRNVRRRSVVGKLIADSTNECIQYSDIDPTDDISEDNTRVMKKLVTEPGIPYPPVRYTITVCNEESTEDSLKTLLRPVEDEDLVEWSSDTVSDGGEPISAENLRVVPEVNIK